jgi:hypothetical protein
MALRLHKGKWMRLKTNGSVFFIEAVFPGHGTAGGRGDRSSPGSFKWLILKIIGRKLIRFIPVDTHAMQ